jgi:serine/threonine protein kinase
MTTHHKNELDARCPTTEELVAFVRGELPAEAGETIARHIEGCTACLATLNQMDGHDDPLLAELRQPVPADLFSQDSGPQAPARADESPPARPSGAGTGCDAVPAPSGAEGPPSPPVVPGYEVLEELGRGGMGVVYRVFDPDLQRRLAIKVLHEQFRGRPDLERRFLAEAQLMAQLQHPGIAPVHDLGRLADGRPFFAMKLVQGRTLAALLDERRTAVPTADLPQLLGIFDQVCQTLAYAHSRGVIHRDLKPSNVMVGAFGEVQVMDWGVAKILRRQGDGASIGASPEPDPLAAVRTQVAGLSAQAGRVLGTAMYMSPEQARGEVEALDERCDVFGLGGIMCVILTGQPPYPGSSLAADAREAELAQAHVRLDGCGADAELLALAKACLAGPWVERPRDAGTVAAAVAAYQTALAERARQAELERAAVAARAGEARKRRRLWGALAALGALVLLGGAAGGLWYAQRESARAEQESALRRQAETNEREALRDKHISQAVRNFLQRDLLRQADAIEQADAARQAGGGFKAKENPTIKELLDRTAVELAPEKIEAKFPNEPEVQASILKTVGETYRDIGANDKAVGFLTRSSDTYRHVLGPDHPDTLTAMSHLAGAYQEEGNLVEAIALCEQVRDGFVKQLGPNNPKTLTSLNNLGYAYWEAGRVADAIVLLEQVRDAFMKLPNADPSLRFGNADNLALAYRAAGKTTEALALHQQVWDAEVKMLGVDHPATLATLQKLAVAYLDAGRPGDAFSLLEQVRDATVKQVGTEHPNTLRTLASLARAYRGVGKMTEAIALYQRVRDTQVKKLGANHPDTIYTLQGLAHAYLDTGNTADAIALLEQVRDGRVKKFGADHPKTLTTLSSLGWAYLESGRTREALDLLQQVRDAIVRQLGADHPDTLMALNNLGMANHAAGKEAEAVTLLEQVREVQIKKLGADHPVTLATLNNLGGVYLQVGRTKEAIALCEQVRDAMVKKLGGDHPDILKNLNNLAGAYRAVGKMADAIALYEQVRHAYVKKLGADHPHTITSMNNLAVAYAQAGKTVEPSPCSSRCATPLCRSWGPTTLIPSQLSTTWAR